MKRTRNRMSASEITRRLSRRHRRSSDIATTTETQNLLESVQVNEDIAQFHDLLMRIGSHKDSTVVRIQICSVIRHCLEAARNAKDRFLYIILQCRDNCKLQSQAGQQLGIFGLCLTYMQREMQRGLQLVITFPKEETGLTAKTMQRDMDELGEILQMIEKHVHYIRPCSESETPELFRSKSDRGSTSTFGRHTVLSKNVSLREGYGYVFHHRHHEIRSHSSNPPFCTSISCIPKKTS